MDKVKLYEGMFLIDSNLAVKDWSGIETHIHDILKKHGAELLYFEKWPDRKLAYDVKGCKKGTYYLTYFKILPQAMKEIDRDVKLSERILRSLFVQEPGLEREMERRKNREITAPPADLTFEDDRFEGRDFGYGRGRRHESAAPPASSEPASVTEESGEGGP